MSFVYRILFLALFILVSCESEDDNPVILASLEGTWQLQARIFDGAPESLTDCELRQTVSFGEGGDFEMYWIAIEPCEFSQFDGTYLLAGEQLNIALPEWIGGSEAFTANYKVLLLDDMNLRVELLNDSERGDYPDTEKTILEFDKVLTD